MRVLLALFLLSLFTIDAGADCRHFVRHHVAPVVHHAAAIHHNAHHVNAAVFVPVILPVLQHYNVAYGPPDHATQERLDRIEKKLDAKAATAEPQPLKMPVAGGERAPAAHLAIVLAKAHCASCHSAGNAKAKGAGFALFDSSGAYVDPGDQKAGEATLLIASGAMPKGRKMNAEDRLTLIQGLLAGGN